LEAARALDEAPFTRQQVENQAWPRPRPYPRTSVIDAYNEICPIEEVLSSHGYYVDGKRAIRPGGVNTSITINNGRSFHHHTNDPLSNGRWHDAFEVFCQLEHRGDVQQAVKAAAGMLGISFEAETAVNGAHAGLAIGGKLVKPTDDELCDLWRESVPPTAYGLGEFRRYNAGVWHEVSSDAVKAEIVSILCQQKPAGIRPTANLAASVMELARVKVAVPAEMWDADPDLLVCANGTLKISTGCLGPHSPNDYATAGLRYAYDPDAAAPIWQKYLASTVPDAADFIQEFAGYTLTGDTSYEIALWLNGPPGGSKSTFIDGLTAMLGPRVCNLGLAALERSNFALTNLPGKTLAVSTEQPSDFVKCTHLLNAIISGERVTVERKYQHPVDIVPRAKLVWAMNELPRIHDAGNGLFRRVRVINFPGLAAGARDPQVKETIKQEGAGILNWGLVGLRRLRARGTFEIPEHVERNTEEFREANDVASIYISESCVLGPAHKTQAKTFYVDYRNWCLDNGHAPKSSTSLAQDWKRLGLIRKTARGLRYWHGVALRRVLDGCVEGVEA
jgi:P4 family phage/plasmid primase-like protien